MARMTSSTVGSSALTSGSRTSEMDSDSEMLLKWWLLGTADTSLSQISTKLQLAKAPTIMFVLFVTDCILPSYRHFHNSFRKTHLK